QRVDARHRKIAARQMQLRQRLSDRGAMRSVRLARPHPFEEIDDRRGPAGERTQRFAAAHLHRLRTDDAVAGEMRHQAEKERQVVFRDALFIQREEEVSSGGMQQEVGILDALGDALVGQQLADVVMAQKLRKLVGGDVGVNRHDLYAASGRSERGNGKNSFSSAAETVSTWSSS